MNRKLKSIRYYPIFINIQGKKCVVVGGGRVSLRKVKMLLDFGAKVTVISPSIVPELKRLKSKKAIRFVQHDYEPTDLRDAVLVIAATDSEEINRRVAESAKREKALANVVDDPDLSDFIVPSFFRRGDLMIAVSTAGMSPALARKIRARIEKNLGETYGDLLSLVKEVRSALKKRRKVVNPNAWQEGLDLDLLTGLLRAGHREEAKKVLLEKLRGAKD